MEKEKVILLSSLDPDMSKEEVMNYLLDKKVYVVMNDLLGKPYERYTLDKLLDIWDLITFNLYWGK